MLGPTLETARLILRPPSQEDFEAIATMRQEEETMRYIGGMAPRDGAWRTLAVLTGSWALLGYSMFSVIEKDGGRWIGSIGPWRPGGEQGGWPGTEVGWSLIAAVHGKGYAHEAATASIDWAFDHLGWEHVIHCIDKRNIASIKLAERLGSQRERENVPLPPPSSDHVVDIYGQSRAAWKARPR